MHWVNCSDSNTVQIQSKTVPIRNFLPFNPSPCCPVTKSPHFIPNSNHRPTHHIRRFTFLRSLRLLGALRSVTNVFCSLCQSSNLRQQFLSPHFPKRCVLRSITDAISNACYFAKHLFIPQTVISNHVRIIWSVGTCSLLSCIICDMFRSTGSILVITKLPFLIAYSLSGLPLNAHHNVPFQWLQQLRYNGGKWTQKLRFNTRDLPPHYKIWIEIQASVQIILAKRGKEYLFDALFSRYEAFPSQAIYFRGFAPIPRIHNGRDIFQGIQVNLMNLGTFHNVRSIGVNTQFWMHVIALR